MGRCGLTLIAVSYGHADGQYRGHGGVMNRPYKALWTILMLATAIVAQATEPRIALVIGNSQYISGALSNPGNDAKLIGDTLTKLGFDVVLRREADQLTMKRAIEDFGARLTKAGPNAVGLFYYAGHGVQLNGRNYLIPTTAHIEREGDMDIEAVSADWVLEQMQYAQSHVNIVILDACRNNPFKRSMRSMDRGLAVMNAPKGTVIAYSTAPGEVAADGDGRDSPYSSALASAMLKSQDVVEEIFKHVRVSVLDATGGKQTPWEASSLTGDFYFGRSGGKSSMDERPGAPVASTSGPGTTVPTTAAVTTPAANSPAASSPAASSAPSSLNPAVKEIASSVLNRIIQSALPSTLNPGTPSPTSNASTQIAPVPNVPAPNVARPGQYSPPIPYQQTAPQRGPTTPPGYAQPPRVAAAPNAPGSGAIYRNLPITPNDVCANVVGRWRELGMSGEIAVEANHSLAWWRNRSDTRPAATGTWNCQSPPNRRFVFAWSTGAGVETLTLSADGTTLAGSNQRGQRIVSTRVSAVAQQPRWVLLGGARG